MFEDEIVTLWSAQGFLICGIDFSSSTSSTNPLKNQCLYSIIIFSACNSVENKLHCFFANTILCLLVGACSLWLILGLLFASLVALYLDARNWMFILSIQDIVEAKEFLGRRGVDVGSDWSGFHHSSVHVASSFISVRSPAP